MIKEYIEYLKDNPQGYWFKIGRASCRERV